MYTASTLLAGLAGITGWRQNPDPSGWQLSAAAILSSSGTYYNDAHPMLTLANLAAVAPDFTVLHPADAAAQATAFSAWLIQKTQAAQLKCVDDWLYMKYGRASAGNLLEWTQLFETNPRQDLDPVTGQFVGFEIFPARSRAQAIRITEIGLQFTQNQPVTVLAFCPGTLTPVFTSPALVYTGSGSVQWFPLNLTIDSTRAYLLGYNQSTMSGQSINSIADYNALWEGQTQFPKGKLFHATAISAPVSAGTVSALWDVADTEYTVSTNYGINLRLTVECDYTAFILDQKQKFRQALTKRVAMDLVNELSHDPESRVNRHNENSAKSEIRLVHDIEGDTQGRAMGLAKEYGDALKSIAFDDSRIDRLCLPAQKRTGVRFKSMTGSLPNQNWNP